MDTIPCFERGDVVLHIDGSPVKGVVMRILENKRTDKRCAEVVWDDGGTWQYPVADLVITGEKRELTRCQLCYKTEHATNSCPKIKGKISFRKN